MIGTDNGIITRIYGSPAAYIPADLQEKHNGKPPTGLVFHRCPTCNARVNKRHGDLMAEPLVIVHWTFFECTSCGYVHIKSVGFSYDDPY